MARPRKNPVDTAVEAQEQSETPFKPPVETCKSDEAKGPVIVTPVYGPMHHPFLNLRIEGPTAVAEIDSWLQCQLDAGKLEVA